MQLINNILYITGVELIISDDNPNGIMLLNTYMSLKKRNKIATLGRGGNGNTVLVEYNSLPLKYRQAWEKENGDPNRKAGNDTVLSMIEIDNKAAKFYADWKLADGESLKAEVQTQYTNEASILNTVHKIVNQRIARRKSDSGGSVKKGEMFEKLATTIHNEEIQRRYTHSLPKTGITLKRRLKHYLDNGYAGLVHSGYCNDNSRKVSLLVERLLMSLYTMKNKPFCATVFDMYNMFIQGRIEVFDQKTGIHYRQLMLMMMM